MSKRGRAGASLVALVATLALGAASPALASTTFVTIDDPAPAVEEVDGGGYKLSVGLTNITDGPVDVGLDATSPKVGRGCAVTIGNGARGYLPAASHGDVELKFNAGCTEKDLNSVVLGAGPRMAQKVVLTPKNPERAKPDWAQLWAFAIALGGAAVLVSLLAFIWNVPLGKELTNLPETWKFSDSLVTNVTLVGGTLAGVVGSSDVVKAFLGKDADASIALATVGAAVAAAIIGLGAVVLQTWRKNGHFTVGGLMTAAAIILGGAYGELYVMWQNGEELTLGGWQDRLTVVVVPLALLLLAYALVSLTETLQQGLVTAKPAPLKLTADAIAATIIASECFCDVTSPDLAQQVRDALNGESDGQSTELEDGAAKPARIEKLTIKPKASLVRKSALL